MKAETEALVLCVFGSAMDHSEAAIDGVIAEDPGGRAAAATPQLGYRLVRNNPASERGALWRIWPALRSLTHRVTPVRRQLPAIHELERFLQHT
jgi:hypothetical protein